MPEFRRRSPAFAAVLTIFTVIFASNLPTPLYGVWQAEWGFSSTALTGVFAVYVLGVLLMLPTAGPLSDKLGRRQLMLPGMAFTLVAALVFAAATDLYWLALGRFLTGIGTGMVTGAATAALVELDPCGNRARAGVISALAFTAGATAGPLFSALGLRWLPWPMVTSFVPVGLLALATMIVLLRADWPAQLGRQTFRLRHWRPQRLSIPREIIGGFVVAGAAVALTWSTGSLYASLGPSIAVELVGIDDRTLAGLYAAAFQLLAGLGQLGFRQQPTQRLMMLGPAWLAVGTLIGVGGMVFASPALFTAGTVMMALAAGATAVGSIALVSLLAPDDRRGEVISAFYMVAYLTMATVVLGVGAASDRIGLRSTVALLAVLVVAIAAWLVRTCRRRMLSEPALERISALPSHHRTGWPDRPGS